MAYHLVGSSIRDQHLKVNCLTHLPQKKKKVYKIFGSSEIPINKISKLPHHNKIQIIFYHIFVRPNHFKHNFFIGLAHLHIPLSEMSCRDRDHLSVVLDRFQACQVLQSFFLKTIWTEEILVSIAGCKTLFFFSSLECCFRDAQVF